MCVNKCNLCVWEVYDDDFIVGVLFRMSDESTLMYIRRISAGKGRLFLFTCVFFIILLGDERACVRRVSFISILNVIFFYF